MSADTDALIDTFFGWFEEQYRFVCQLPDLLDHEQISSGYQCDVVTASRLLLTCAHIDALAHVAGQKTRTTGRDFSDTLLRFTGEPQWHLVSLSELSRALDAPSSQPPSLRRRLAQFGGRRDVRCHLRRHVDAMRRRLQSGTTMGLAMDFDKDVCRTEKDLASEAVQVDRDLRCLLGEFRLAGVFYREYRCRLVHRSQTPVSGQSDLGLQVPKYHVSVMGGRARVLLEIPPAFAGRALGSLVCALRDRCRKDGTNPYEFLTPTR